MNIFSVGDGEAYELTRNEYINRTHKKFPFYQDVKNIKHRILQFVLHVIIQFRL